jgi:hydrogenase/urease accessory protein HupE
MRTSTGGRGGLVLGYAHLPEPGIVRAVAALGKVVARAAETPPAAVAALD